ncbi:unnamed protein product [Peronospora farinosa]|uniref:Vesicle transport protein n=1 Tax=Peronospora farinosa TaxID=134698 RepID=A0AAV0SXQ5_9STRA|nr:unnamed protein product [Peronospora farinosa]CAI5707926.1 unnamed protein product [Peronospora farinosa]
MSASEQWEGKKPTSSGLQDTQDVFHSLLRTYSLSTVSSSSIDIKSSASFSLKKAWNTARDLTKNAVETPTVSNDTADVMENGQINKTTNNETAVKWPFMWERESTGQSIRTSTMSWHTRFKYFVGMAMLGMLFIGMAVIFLPLIMVRPSKFALSFALGGMCSMGVLAMLKGLTVYARSRNSKLTKR